jgi:hypothetical protein
VSLESPGRLSFRTDCDETGVSYHIVFRGQTTSRLRSRLHWYSGPYGPRRQLQEQPPTRYTLLTSQFAALLRLTLGRQVRYFIYIMTENGQGFSGAVKRFSGKGVDAAEDYRRWRRWSRAYLVTQRARGLTPESVGSLLYTLLDDIALKSVDGIDFDNLEETGGEHLLYDLLDERFPEQEAHDKIGAALDSVFALHIDKGEKMAEFTGRCKEVFDVAEREGIPFPSVAKGYMVLRGARLTLD